MRTLLTGFGPFGATVNNPSARIVDHFAREGAPGHELTTHVLPVSYERAGLEICTLLREGEFDAAVLMGVARGEALLRIEQGARRQESGHALDCDGQTPSSVPLPTGALDIYLATLHPEPVVAALTAAGVPARLSVDAGGYVCNHAYYAALRTIAEAELRTRCLFVHVPADAETFAEPFETPTLPLELQIRGIGQVLALLAEPATQDRVPIDRGEGGR